MNMLLLVLDCQLWASQGINGNVNVKTRNFMKPKNLKNCQVCQVTTYVFQLEIKSHVQTKPKTLPKYFTHDFLNLSRIFTLTEILSFCVVTKFESPCSFVFIGGKIGIRLATAPFKLESVTTQQWLKRIFGFQEPSKQNPTRYI